MPFETLRIIPSVDVEETLADNAAGISESNFIRWREKLPEKRGGCTLYSNNLFDGIARDLHAWQGLSQDKRLAIGTTKKLYVGINNQYRNITPQTQTTDILPSLSSTSGSSIVTVTDPDKAAPSIYDGVVFNTQISVGNILLFGAYQITAITGPNTYTIETGIVSNLTTTTEVAPIFQTVDGSSVVTCFLPNVNPSISASPPANYYYAPGEVIAFLVPTEVGGVTIQGEYTVKTATASQITFNAQNSATLSSTQILNYGYLNLTYYVTIGPQQAGKGYGQGFYSTFTDVANVTGASSSAGFATLTFTGTHYFQDNETVTVTGVGSPYDGTHKLSQAEFNFVSYPLGVAPTLGAGGTVTAVHASGGYGTGIPAPSQPAGATEITTVDWTLDNWGENLISCPRNGPIFVWSIDSGYYNSAIIPQAPVKNAGMFVAMPQRQIMAWGSTFNGVQDPLQIRWCDANNYNVWDPVPGENLAGDYRIPTGSLIVGALQGPQQQYWFTDIDVYVSQFTGNVDDVYGFNKIGSGCGLISPKAMTTLNSNIYWMSQRQFFVVSGVGSAQPIPCSVWDFVFQNLNTAYVDNIRAASNSMFNEVSWFFPSALSVSGENDAYVCYNVLYNEWDYGYLPRTAWIDQSVLGGPIATSYTDTGSEVTSGSNVFQHETAYDLAGEPIHALMKTGYFSLTNGNDLVFVDWMLPDMKWGTFSGSDTAELNVSFNVTDYTGQQPTLYGPYKITHTTEYIEPRFRGRFVQIIIESNDLNSFWRLGSFRYRYATTGRR